jgi:hypothetical protein
VKTVSGIGGMPPPVWFVGVEATNSGRLGTEIEQFGFQLPLRKITATTNKLVLSTMS